MEALSLPEDVAGSARPSQRNVSEWQSPPNVANNANGVIAKQPNNQQQSADLCDQLHLTPRQKQMCVQGGDGLAGTLLEGLYLIKI